MNRRSKHPLALSLLFICFVPLLRQSAPGQAAAESDRADTTISPAGQQPDLRWYVLFANISYDIVRFSRITFRPGNIPRFVGMAALTTALAATDAETWHLIVLAAREK